MINEKLSSASQAWADFRSRQSAVKTEPLKNLKQELIHRWPQLRRLMVAAGVAANFALPAIDSLAYNCEDPYCQPPDGAVTALPAQEKERNLDLNQTLKPARIFLQNLLTQALENSRAKHFDPHALVWEIMANPDLVATGVYGTPVGGSSLVGWGSVNNNWRRKHYNPYDNYQEITQQLANELTNKQIRANFADLVLIYGRSERGYLNIVNKSADFAEFVHNEGDIVFFNLRPPGDFSVAELRELVEKIWTGHATYLDGSQVVSQEFIKESGPILSLDLEEMLRGTYPEGVPATELNTVIETYIEIMRSYGFAKPVIFLYERGLGEPDMVDDVSQLNTENIIIIYSGFVPEGDLEYKIQGTIDLITAYGKTRGGCMIFDSQSLSQVQRDDLTPAEIREYINNDVCAFVLPQGILLIIGAPFLRSNRSGKSDKSSKSTKRVAKTRSKTNKNSKLQMQRRMNPVKNLPTANHRARRAS